MVRRSIACLVIGASALSLAALPAASSSLWAPRDSRGVVALEFLRPSTETVDADAFVGAAFLSGRTAPRRGVSLVAELPVARQHAPIGSPYYGAHFPSVAFYVYGESFSSSTIGNPYLGIETAPRTSPLFVEVGIRLPLASRDEVVAIATGMSSDVTRWEAFLDHVLSIQAAFNVREVTSSRVFYRFRLSPVLQVPTEGGSEDPDLYALYSWQVGYEGRALRIGAGIASRTLLTGGVGNLGARSLSQVELHGDFLGGSVRPGLDLHLPLDSFGSVVPLVVGGSVTLVP